MGEAGQDRSVGRGEPLHRCAVAARGWLGTPYRHQASVKGQGADCLGLVRGVWREVVGAEPEAVPAYSPDWAEVGGRETLLEAAGRWLVPVPVEAMAVGDRAVHWQVGELPRTVGRPVFHVLDLPPLPGFEDDDRPLVAAAAEPWVPMAVLAGPDAETLTERAVVEMPATLGVLVEALGPGALDRRDTVNTVVVSVEGRAPASLGELAILGGANALAVQTSEGWEVVQFHAATLIGGGVWRLGALLRGQQGTDEQMRAGASVGAAVVFLDEAVTRVKMSRAERGLDLVWRAGPAGAPPGGAGFAERVETVRGVHDRGWSPVHLTVARVAEGVRVAWTPRVRVHGDGWDREPVAVDGQRFRVRVLDGDGVRRVAEVNGPTWLYENAMMVSDFPGGLAGGLRIGVAQWSDGYGWGSEGGVALPATPAEGGGASG